MISRKRTIEKKLKINTNELRKVNTVKELMSKPPFMVLGKVIIPCEIGGANEERLKLTKGQIVAMPLGAFLTSSRSKKDRRKLIKPYNRQSFSDIFKRYVGQNLDYKKILIWRGGGFGDLLFLQPVMKKIKKLYPSCKLTVACYNRFKDILKDFPPGLIDGIVPVPVDKKILEQNDYHLAIEGVIERCKEAEKRVCYDLMAEISGLDIDFRSDDFRLELIPNENLVKEFRHIIPNNFVIAQLRASSPIRMIPDFKWADIIKRIVDLGKNVVIVDKCENKHLYKHFMEKFNLKEGVYNFSEYCPSINHSIALTSLSDGVIAIDSVFTHISEALNKPLLGIYGSFLGELRLKYYRNADWVQSKTTCPKAPCFWHHENKYKCRSLIETGYPECMTSVDVDEIITKFKKLFIKETING